MLKNIATILGQFNKETGNSFLLTAQRKFEGTYWVYSKDIGRSAERYYEKNCPQRSPQSVMEFLQPDTLQPSATTDAFRSVKNSQPTQAVTGVKLQRKQIRGAIMDLVQKDIPAVSSRTVVQAKRLKEMGATLMGFQRSVPNMHWTNTETYDEVECPAFLTAYNNGQLKVILDASI